MPLLTASGLRYKATEISSSCNNVFKRFIDKETAESYFETGNRGKPRAYTEEEVNEFPETESLPYANIPPAESTSSTT